MLADPLKVPAAAVEFDKDDQVRCLRIIGERMDSKPIELGAFFRFLQRSQIKIGFVVCRSRRKEENSCHRARAL